MKMAANRNKQRGNVTSKVFLWGMAGIFLLSCAILSNDIEPSETEAPESTEHPDLTALPQITSEPAPDVTTDEWSLWANGTQLRGANTWQRIVVPDLDGNEFLGDGYIGPPYTQSDFDELAALGANYVNLSHPGLFTERPPYVTDEQVQANLDHMIEMAANADLFVVISFRTGPGRSDFTFYRDGAGDWFDADLLIESVWSDQAAQEAWVEMWRYTAERFRDNPVVVGYDLMCEPNSSGVVFEIYEPSDFHAQYADTIYDWNQFYPLIVAGIREVDQQTPILVGGNGWSGVRWLTSIRPVDDPRVIYTVHQYEPQESYTHQEPPALNTYPGLFDLNWDDQPDTFERAWLEGFLNPIDEFIARFGAPVAVNEFGINRWVPNAADFMRDEMELFEQRGMNHAFWVWDPVWQPWNEGVNGMNYRYGPDPDNIQPVDNDLLTVIKEFWSRNSVRPSNFQSSVSAPRRSALTDVRTWFYFIGDVPEQVWFDGGADNDPEGDCPLPRTIADVDTDAYYDSLPPACQDQFDEYPESTLHVSSEEYLHDLVIAMQKGLRVFTVDYALQPDNVIWVYRMSRSLGFIHFVSNRGLDIYLPPVS